MTLLKGLAKSYSFYRVLSTTHARAVLRSILKSSVGGRRDYTRCFVRLIFLGSPSFAVPSLEALLGAGHDVALVVTQPDRPAGRGRRTTPPPVAAYALEHGLPVWQTSSVRGGEAEARLRAVGAEAMALAAFAALIPTSVLAIAPILNVHPSLLPRWRGAAPIQAALLAGETETGVSIIRLVEALDAGPILVQEHVAIAPEDDYLSLEPRLASLGASLLVRALADAPRGAPQDDRLATYCKRIEREDARIQWSRPAREIWHRVRAYRGWPQAFTTWDGRTLKVLRAWPVEAVAEAPGTVLVLDGAPVVATGGGALRLDELVLEGRRPQTGAEFLRGYAEFARAKVGQ
jgi:methionyl-tRNA formyltransferase